MAGGFANDRVSQDLRESTRQIPRLEKRRPINVLRQQAKIHIAEMPTPNELRLHRRELTGKFQLHLVTTSLLERQHRQGFLASVLHADTFIVGGNLVEIPVTRFIGQQ